jgi:hypothetical protein
MKSADNERDYRRFFLTENVNDFYLVRLMRKTLFVSRVDKTA